MARYDFRRPRLYVDHDLGAGASVNLEPAQAHYLINVLRLKPGADVLAFNGRDGEWRADVMTPSRRAASLVVKTQTRPQPQPTNLHYLFAPLKRARLDYMVQKAVELGASFIVPVLTRHTQVERVNLARMRANAIEAAEQCGVLALPEITTLVALERALAALEPARLLVFCDEDAPVADPVAALAAVVPKYSPPPLAVLIGPEGGFTEEERALLLRRGGVVRLALGPRILRADTAAVAALSLVQAVLGDWA
jgi:16S rRNA (uracil1498-N3)-methyltransferase